MLRYDEIGTTMMQKSWEFLALNITDRADKEGGGEWFKYIEDIMDPMIWTLPQDCFMRPYRDAFIDKLRETIHSPVDRDVFRDAQEKALQHKRSIESKHAKELKFAFDTYNLGKYSLNLAFGMGPSYSFIFPTRFYCHIWPVVYDL
jgi:hypothetical protein